MILVVTASSLALTLVEQQSPPGGHSLQLHLSHNKVFFKWSQVIAIVNFYAGDNNHHNGSCSFDFDDIAHPDPQTWSGQLPPTGTFLLPFQFLTLGSHYVRATCFIDGFHQYELSDHVFVYNRCFSDDPIFSPLYWINSPLRVLNSVTLQLESRTILLCPEPSFTWWMDEITPGGVAINKPLAQLNKDFITFPPGGLEPALYR